MSERDVPRPVQAEMRLLLTVTEAARALGVGRSLVYELVTAGEIASIKIGRARRIPVPALEAFVRQRLAAQQEECGTIELGEDAGGRVRYDMQGRRPVREDMPKGSRTGTGQRPGSARRRRADV